MLLRFALCRAVHDNLGGLKHLSEWQYRDAVEATAIHTEKQMPQIYQKLTHEWQHALVLKDKYRERRKAREAEIEPAKPMPAKLVLHAESKEVPTPLDHEMFAVITLAGLQYKVTKDDVLKVEKLPYDIGAQIVIDQVLLVGTPWYTLLGRPQVEKAKVYLSVEEQTKSEKLLVFKKKRRKGYQKSKGHRQLMTILRVDKIEHVVETPEAVVLPSPVQPAN